MMKKPTFLLLLLLLTATIGHAAPALRGSFTVTQSDGSLLTIEQYGDEHHHWTATTDGTLVVNSGQGYYVARISETGQLEATDQLAHNPDRRGSKEETLSRLQSMRRSLFFEQGEQASRRAVSINDNSSYGYLPHQGDVRVLCILAEFQDVKFTVSQPAQAFDQLLNADTQQDLGNHNNMNVASVCKYFETSSHDNFSPQFDVVGPVTLPKNMAYYGKGDERFSAFCTDAIAKVNEDGLVTDWSLYDNRGDKKIELVCIIYAGYGENQGGDDNTIWAKASYINYKANDEYRVSFFNCSCELFHTDARFAGWINGTGVFIHEMSHCMGLPDLYMTTSSGYVNNQGMEAYDIMDYGCYNNNGYAPCLYTAWEQEAMGWTTIEPVTEARQLTNLQPLEYGGKAYKVVNPDDENDFIVMENIQKRGLNSDARGHGLLVYHVAYPYSTVNMGNSPNNTSGRPAVAVVPAGGTLINAYLRGTGKEYTSKQWTESMAAAPFPGTQHVTTLNDDMGLPNYCFYGSSSASPSQRAGATKPVGFTLTGITEDEDAGTVSVQMETTAIATPQVTVAPQSTAVYNLRGQRVTSPAKGLYITGGKTVHIK
jgi:immune inhibitor A